MINTGIGKLGFPFSNNKPQDNQLKITDDFLETVKLLSSMSRDNGTSIKIETKHFSVHISPFNSQQNTHSGEFLPKQVIPKQSTESVKTTVEKEKNDNIQQVISPMVGTVYLGPNPKEKFVEIGSKVKKGDSVLIVETMKVMNHITAPCSGTISSICVENEQSVEYGQLLMEIET